MRLTRSDTDTIAAIATPRGMGGIGVIRVSGERAVTTVRRVFLPSRGRRYNPTRSHSLTHGHIVDPTTHAVVDEVLVAYFRPPTTYTGEEMVEVSTHGGDVVLRTVLTLLCENGARLANPGEFTQRAFLNGRIDLAQAEAVADVIYAKTETSLRAAASQLTGVLSDRLSSVRGCIVSLLAEVEAAIDFPDEDLHFHPSKQLAARAQEIRAEVATLLAHADRGRFLRDGFDVVIAGKPNVGKSSLLNALLQEDRAIVTEVPGTTRDIVEDYANIHGVPVRLADTAGIREPTDAVEREGVARSNRRVAVADLVLLVLDTSRPLDGDDRDLLVSTSARPRMLVLNKADLDAAWEPSHIEREAQQAAGLLQVSAKTRAGLDELMRRIAGEALGDCLGDHTLDAEIPIVTNLRHRAALRDADDALGHAIRSLDADASPELVAVDLRAALDALGLIVGETTTEEVLIEIFSRFCVGK